jgi:predicted SnoaL-like aldol condensation-catalyzing enzyme
MPVAMNALERNKQNVTQFYDLMFNKCRPREAAQRFMAKWFTQHNPAMADGPEAFIRFYDQLAIDHPGKRVEFKRVIAEGDLVVLHCRHKWADGPEFASVEIYRLNDEGMIEEHWDVIQKVPDPEKTANTNSMF